MKTKQRLRPRTVSTAALVCIGGFIGAIARFGVDAQINPLASTLLVNTIGCLLIGFFIYYALETHVISRETRLVLVTGFISSLTTYSGFALDIFNNPDVAVIIMVSHYALGFTATHIGWVLASKTKVKTK